MKAAAMWGDSPQSQPRLGQPWIDLTLSTYAPALRVFDGQSWILAATLDTLAGTLVLPADGSIATLASATTVTLEATARRVVVVTGTLPILSFGAPLSMFSRRIVVFSGSLTLNAVGGVIDLPRGRPIFTALGDVAVLTSNGGAGWRLLSYWQASVVETALNFDWASFAAAPGLTEQPPTDVHGSIAAGLAAIGGFSPVVTQHTYRLAITAGFAAANALGVGRFGVSYNTNPVSFAAVAAVPWPVQYAV